MTLMRRALMVTVVLLAMVQPTICGLYAYGLWQYRSAGHQTDDGIAANVHLAEMLAALALVDVIAVLVFLLRSRSYGRWVLTAVQIANAFAFLVWFVATPTWDPGRFAWLLCAVTGFGTVALVFVFTVMAWLPRNGLTAP